ncbi:hypothetical protein EVAR_9874_1 [Eumeta japonica]|uniref:Uncharacterized protein n=1 Tax=Eumeta variegata TaxID=151549 RepID=A0A4C1TQ98_EUMVA|nr:hypothetical protein EVAR_9874_1 [Eumeta japonica]
MRYRRCSERNAVFLIHEFIPHGGNVIDVSYVEVGQQAYFCIEAAIEALWSNDKFDPHDLDVGGAMGVVGLFSFWTTFECLRWDTDDGRPVSIIFSWGKGDVDWFQGLFGAAVKQVSLLRLDGTGDLRGRLGYQD